MTTTASNLIRYGFQKSWTSYWHTSIKKKKANIELLQDLQLKEFFSTLFNSKDFITSSVLIKRVFNKKKIFVIIPIFFLNSKSLSYGKQSRFFKKMARLKASRSKIIDTDFPKSRYKTFESEDSDDWLPQIRKPNYKSNFRKMYFKLLSVRWLVSAKIKVHKYKPFLNPILEEENTQIYISVISITKIHNNSVFISHYLRWLLEDTVRYNYLLKKVLRLILRDCRKSFCITGIQISIAGKWNAASRSQLKTWSYGKLAFNTITSRVDYHYTQGLNKYGAYGIKVWISKNKISDLFLKF